MSVATPLLLNKYPTGQYVMSVAFHPTMEFFAIGLNDGILNLCKLEKRKKKYLKRINL